MLKFVVLSLVMLNLSVMAQEKPKDQSSDLYCVSKVVEIIKFFDSLNNTHFSNSDIKTQQEIRYNEASSANETIVTYTVDKGEQAFEVVMKPNYYGDGVCVYESSTLRSQD